MAFYELAWRKERRRNKPRRWNVLHVDHKSLQSSSTPVEESVPAPDWFHRGPALVYPYRAGLIGGALGGLAMIAVAVAFGAPLETLTQLNAAALTGGLFLHAAISMGLGFVFALLLPTLPGSPVLWSLPIGTLLWSLAGLMALPLLNPVMVDAVDVPSFLVAHLVYGLVLGAWIARTPKIRADRLSNSHRLSITPPQATGILKPERLYAESSKSRRG